MKTGLTGKDLMFVADLLAHQLKICNHTEKYKERCIEIHEKISIAFDDIQIEMKEVLE